MQSGEEVTLFMDETDLAAAGRSTARTVEKPSNRRLT